MIYTSNFNPFSLYGPTTGVGFEATCGAGDTSNGVSYIGAYNQYEMPDLSESDAGTLGFCKNLKQYLIWTGSEWVDQYQNTIETHEKQIGPNHLVFTSNTNGSTVCIKSYVIPEDFGNTPDYYDYYSNIENGQVNNPRTKYSLDNGVTFNVYNGEVFTLDKNKSVHFIAQGDNFCHPDMLYFGLSFVVEGDVSVSGNLYDSLTENGNSIEPDEQEGGNYRFSLLFTHCNGLTDASQLVLPYVLGESMFGGMFSNCQKLVTVPELPATTLADNCYKYMFNNCASLTTAPELPATELADGCYSRMFIHCTSLATAPELPATILSDSCYSGMFQGCTGLTMAPELPATTLANNCYIRMFSGCEKLASITVGFNTFDFYNDETSNWLDGVASEGTFSWHGDEYYDGDRGSSTIPEGWTIIHKANDPLRISMEVEGSSDIELKTFKHNGEEYVESENLEINVEYSYDGKDWQTYNGEKITLNLDGYETVYFRGMNESLSSPEQNVLDSYYSKFVFSNFDNVRIRGDVTSLLNNVGGDVDLSGKDFCFYNLFNSCSKLVTWVPKLPSTKLSNHCYSNMFSGCTMIDEAPELPATELADYCYENMFSGCTSLNTITCLATDISADGCTQGWLENVDSSGTFTKAASMTDWQTGADGIPENWTVIDAD